MCSVLELWLIQH